jgi:hypothetical protein
LSEENTPLTRELNNSGFPLQLAVAELVQSNLAGHGWRILYQEHSWINRTADNRSGFIDVVAERNASVLTIECKRVRDVDWLFAVSPLLQQSERVVGWVSMTPNGPSNWFDGGARPSSVESSICVVRGQNDSRRTMLESVASEAILATEALAIQERPILEGKRYGFRHYCAAIVTTAKLKVATVDSGLVSIKTGEIGELEWKEVPYLRFAKQLTNHGDCAINRDASDLRYRAAGFERTVFVINSTQLASFLRDFELNNSLYQSALFPR